MSHFKNNFRAANHEKPKIGRLELVYCTSLISLKVVLHFMFHLIKITQLSQNSSNKSNLQMTAKILK